ncbi:hypothetical protein DU000_07945 [Parvibium lacunae]|uniref:Uncharacterized protein n=1 Tax=Parvibium lacunae TaxID=1888893 RepID=A0A368L1E0_9BURK|nr:hypothetical protein DU000_07945 [Parvibium lacunae]
MPFGIPGMGELIDGAMQQAAQRGRQLNETGEVIELDKHGSIHGNKQHSAPFIPGLCRLSALHCHRLTTAYNPQQIAR